MSGGGLVIFLPIHLLWRAKITRRQKLLLSGIFSLSVVIIIVAIVRVAVNTPKPGQQLESTWVFLWSFIESSVGTSLRNFHSISFTGHTVLWGITILME